MAECTAYKPLTVFIRLLFQTLDFERGLEVRPRAIAEVIENYHRELQNECNQCPAMTGKHQE